MHWMFASGVLRCLSPREIKVTSSTDFGETDTIENYREVAAVFGYEYLGGKCDVTELLQEPGTMLEKRWEKLAWLLPDNTLDPCWWLVRLGSINDSEHAPKFLCRSLGVMRAELHRSRVATIP